ncbi:gluconate 2-dehydrogenase subunit 3 family protein [Hymenobacter mucosus]|uniref:Gluconate 2-dehydrogenase subunit 3 n=1 Tax=Hymenobacter mucosus TaxID=1411120 RepID=A0A238WZJ1_9BACT|nr:gluconate 2-dehydrogenase subunit 3 family protein [Hymenobacter mucosus]SNR51843.1 Gluconate 2-dehydrogenase subunit 3 [Hymenobacter mucosus]
MSSPHYPEGTVRALLQTDLVTEATKAALLPRLQTTPYTPQLFDASTYELLRAVAACIYPQPEREYPIELAPVIDKRLAEGDSDGWRYDVMPPDREAYRVGLGGINQAAEAMYQQPFVVLARDQQNLVMEAVAAGTAAGTNWQRLPIDRFFEELLAELTEAYYSHPLAQEEIGYVGMADVPGWSHLEPNQLEPREPEAL